MMTTTNYLYHFYRTVNYKNNGLAIEIAAESLTAAVWLLQLLLLDVSALAVYPSAGGNFRTEESPLVPVLPMLLLLFLLLASLRPKEDALEKELSSTEADP
jgi:hypothetical protein